LVILLCVDSWKLARVVFAFTGMIAASIALMLPVFRSRLNDLYSAEGSRQAHSVEAIRRNSHRKIPVPGRILLKTKWEEEGGCFASKTRT
jgi:ABC-type bacteriocin/lantibiotic exporter with double-glycine peptidase domain